MSLRAIKSWAVLFAALIVAGGCQPSRPFYFGEDGDLSHYKGVATDLEYPDVEADTLAEVEGALAPLTLSNSEAREIWEVKLEEAVQIGLKNSKIMRTLGGQVVRAPNQLISAPTSVQNIYNAAVIDSDPRFGTEATLSQFDTQFTTSLFWQKNDHPVNLFFPGFLARVFEQDLGTFQAQLAKTAATGTQFFLRENTQYEFNNNPSNLYPSAWNTNIEAEFRHPLLRGSGVQFNRIAGTTGIPGVSGFNDIPGVYNGVALARINTDIALADFEAGVRNFVAEVELAYWELYFAYRNLDTLIVGRDSALQTWRKVKALYDAGARGGEAEKEAQAREQYFLFRGQVESALSNVYQTENQLRYMMGISHTDGRLIRPADTPTTAKVIFDWDEVHIEALARSAELRRQKWVVKQDELKVIASKNFLLPRLDFSARYRWTGFGDDLITAHPQTASATDPFPNAFQTMTGGDFQEWQMGFNASVPIGFRAQLAGVRNAQLSLARDRALLQDQELELDNQLAFAIRDLDRTYHLSETNFNRRIAAEKNVEAVKAAYETDTITLDLLLDAQRRLAVSESEYFRTVVDYNLAIRQVHLRKGSLLEYNGVYLAEGPWPAKAYFDARKRARERDAATFLNYGYTRPSVYSRGPVPQGPGDGGPSDGGQIFESSPRQVPTEAVPTPTPAPVPERAPATSTMYPANAAESGTGPMLGTPQVAGPRDTGPRVTAPQRPRRLPAREAVSANGGSISGGSASAMRLPPPAGSRTASAANQAGDQSSGRTTRSVRPVSYDLSRPARGGSDATNANYSSDRDDRPAASGAGS